MSAFTDAEIAYLNSQLLARIATATADGKPHVVPVAFRYNPETDTIDVGGHNFASRKKFRDAQTNPHVAIVIDDLASVEPWRPRMLEIRGEAEVMLSGGETIRDGFDPEMFRITPTRIVSFGIDPGEPFRTQARSAR
jgi:pyridoxamine 5'-phosphate oxidase family protein